MAIHSKIYVVKTFRGKINGFPAIDIAKKGPVYNPANKKRNKNLILYF